MAGPQERWSLPAVEALLPLEIRVHGRGGQGGVTCAKLVATLYADLGLYVQSFGDYGVERSGAPVRAFTRVDAAPIVNRNKVYAPRHLLVLDATLMGDDVLEGAAPGALLLVNTAAPPDPLAARHPHLRVATVDAAGIARRHGIGTSAVVIVNTSLVGAYARLLGLPWEALERTYAHHELTDDLPAARDAFEAVGSRDPSAAAPPAPRPAPSPPPVLALTDHLQDRPPPFLTGSWRTQEPRYRAHVAPCRAACPAGNDVAAVLEALRTAGVDAAARLLLATQALPSTCGRVCPAPCMDACNRAAYDGAVNVRGLERWIGDGAAVAPLPAPAPARRFSVAVVGGGPAGLSAAFTLARAGHAVTVHEREPRLGGVLRTGIPTYRLPAPALDRDLARLAAQGVAARCGAALGAADVEALAAAHDAVVVATGLAQVADLDAAGPAPAGVGQGLAFLREVRAGRPPSLRGHVAVVGGGNTAVDCARTALRCGADRVTLVYRRTRAEMPALREEIEEALEEGVALLPLRQPVAFVGAPRLAGLELAEVTLGPPDASGRRRPVLGEGRERLACDAALLALGQRADRTLLPAGARGNLWLAGDLASGEGTVAHAVGHGRRVAEQLLARLEGRPEGDGAAFDPADLVTPAHVRFGFFAPGPPRREARRAAPERRRSFEEVGAGLGGPEEAGRCFSCGACTRCDTCLTACPEAVIQRADGGYAVDARYCKGCGMCVAECPRRAMEMVPLGPEGGAPP